MAKRRDTGDGEAYNDPDALAMIIALRNASRRWRQEAQPEVIDVRAQIEWAGQVMTANNGVRSTRLGTNGKDIPAAAMREIRRIAERVAKTHENARQARQAAETAQPSKSRDAKGWHAQLRELTSATKRGSEAADRAGLDPSARTLQRWLSGGTPSKANREAIGRAYEELRTWRVREAHERAAAAERAAEAASPRAAAEEITGKLRDTYGVNVRFRDIQRLEFE